MEITPEKTPAIYHVLERGVVTMRLSATQPKAHYMRKRPFVVFNESTITPEEDEDLGKSGSYPSGHSLRGWGMALILSEINPAAQDTLLRFGYEWGESRVIGNYHWQSDVDASRLLASAALAHLHTNEIFLEDLDKAKREFTLLSGKNDSALEEIARRGGIIGLNLFAPFVGDEPTVDDVLRHADHIMEHFHPAGLRNLAQSWESG